MKYATPRFVDANRKATAYEFMVLNRQIINDAKHPLHAEVSSELRALSMQEAGSNADEPYTGTGFVK